MESVQLAARVGCVSQHTADDVMRLLHIPQDKIDVNPMGAAALPAENDLVASTLKQLGPYILSVGGTDRRKNLDILPEVFKAISNCGNRPTLVRIGPALPDSLASGLRTVCQLVELGLVEDDELAAAYNNASGLLMPSTYEGFGLPVVEAMRQGCPVVCSSTTSLAEVAADAALTFDPGDPGLAAEHLYQLLTNVSLRQALVEKGHERAKLFSYDRHWNQLQECYRSMA
jgi:glycosyltransferase involved in cell wall biosynthesis